MTTLTAEQASLIRIAYRMEPQNLCALLQSLSDADGNLSIEKCAAALVQHDRSAK